MHTHYHVISTDPEAGLERLIGYLRVASAEADLLGHPTLQQQIEDLIEGYEPPEK
jgi:hypothetical protein